MSRRHHHEHGKHEIQGAHRQRAIYLHTLRMHYGGREQYVNDEENIETYKQFAAHLKRTILQTISSLMNFTVTTVRSITSSMSVT